MVNMVDCGSPQCAQERRNFKKELFSWSKKIPLTVALERIAEELAGDEIIQNVLDPLHCLEPQEVTDWEPEENCFYCDSRVKLIFDVVDQLTEDAKNGKLDQDYPNLRYLQEVLPYCTQYYTHGLGRDHIDSGGGGKTGRPSSPVDTEDSEMVVPSSTKAHVELKIPQIPIQAGKHKRESLNGKKAYTDEELAAAVCDIRSGKLGTRRAAMLYGIPRSTLRNKIFKLENEDQIQAEMLADQEDSSSTDENVTDGTMKLSDLMQASSFTYLPPLPFALPFKTEFEIEEQEGEFDRKMELLRKKHNLNGSSENLRVPAHTSELKLPILADLIRKMVEQRLEMERQSASMNTSSECDMTLNDSMANDMTHINHFLPPLSSSCLSLGMSAGSVDLRIPSYKPSNGSKGQTAHDSPSSEKTIGKVYENSKIGETLKNIIVRSISEKMRFRENCQDESSGTVTPDNIPKISAPVSEQTCSVVTSCPTPSRLSQPSSKRLRREAERERRSSTGGPSTSLKKTRPKRGQYRKYNSQLLMEAVRAVQRGEMSVHRAGSYFGVPHSTLEYKVKERHLLRQKKSREAQNQKQTSSPAETSSSNSSTTSQTPVKSESSPISALGFGPPKQASSSGLPWFQPYLNGSPHFDPGMSFFHSGFALSTPASELLRKLQHKVQNKSGSFSQEGTFDFPRPNGVGSLQERFLLFN